MMKLATRTGLMKASPILALAAKANEMKAQGKDVISLTVGEPDWAIADHIKNAAIASINANKSKYTPSNGIVELRKAVALQTSEQLGVKYDPSEVTVTSGAKMILFAALQALCEPGQEVILIAPYWASYTTMVELAEAKFKAVTCGADSNFKILPAQLEKAITANTKAIIFNSPSNPTGMVYTREELKALAEVLRKHPEVVILSDDIYNRLMFSGEAVAPHILHVAPDLKDRTLIMSGASKSFAMTGWRIGWACGPKVLIDAMTAYQSQSVSCANATAQWASLDAVENGDQTVKKSVQNLKERCDFWLSELKQIPQTKAYRPDGAFYIWFEVEKYLGKKYHGKEMKSSADMSLALLEDYLVAVVPGIEFGLEGYFRFSFAIENSKAKEACSRMAKFFSEMKLLWQLLK